MSRVIHLAILGVVGGVVCIGLIGLTADLVRAHPGPVLFGVCWLIVTGVAVKRIGPGGLVFGLTWGLGAAAVLWLAIAFGVGLVQSLLLVLR